MDEKRILAKIDELNSYLEELEEIRPGIMEELKHQLKSGERARGSFKYP